MACRIFLRRNVYIMYGLSISLLMDTQQCKIDVNSIIRNTTPNIIWSEYDRIHFEKVNKFDDFFKLDNTVSCWTGSIQTLHLYSNEIDSSTILNIKDEENTSTYIFDEKHPEIHYPLAMIMSLKINELLFSSNMDNSKIIKEILIKSKDILCNLPIQSFFSLGEEDIVLIVLGNSVDKFMDLIQCLRELKFEYESKQYYVCNFTNSFLVQNSCDLTSVKCKKTFANVYISLNKGINEYNFISEFSEHLGDSVDNLENSTILVGEYDVVLQLRNNDGDLFNLYNYKDDNSLLNAQSPFYKNFIKNSKTIWCINAEDKNDSIKNITINIPIRNMFDFNNSEDVNKRINITIETINNKTNQINNDNTKYVYHNVTYFLKDAAIAYNSATSDQWRYILSKQINAFIDIFDSYDKIYSTKNGVYGYSEEYLIDLNEMITDMRNSFSHINRSHEMFYHTSVSSLHYLGSFNMILISYYNYINKLLELAYKKPHKCGTQQANIIFFVYFGMTSKIKSKIYLNNYSKPNETKLVGFELPYAALYDLKKYLVSLTHEVYHLIAPFDRENRNKRIKYQWEKAYLKKEFIQFVLNECYKIDISNFLKDNETNVSIILGDFFEQYCEYFTDIKFNCKNLDYNTLNTQINSDILNKRDDLRGFYINSFDKFIEYCKGLQLDDNSNKEIYSFFANIKKDLCKFDKTINVDYKTLNQFKAITVAIKECICDTFMYQLSFYSPSKKGEDEYLDYLINFFDERKINFELNTDANLRIGIFLDYINFDFNKSLLDKEKLNKIKIIYGRYRESVGEYREFIKKMIIDEDFFVIFRKNFDDTIIKDIINHENNIYDIIHYLDNNDSFERYISLLNNLNNEFVLFNPDNTNEFNPIENININSSKNVEKTYTNLDKIPTHYAYNLDDYLKCVSRGTKNEIMWYRGICNYTYKLIPSLYVHLPDKAFPYYFQNSLLRQSYDETKKNYHTFSKHEFPSAMRQSLMQHYGVPTNLLDFSTDPLASLYWALNPDNEKDKNYYTSAVVYLFYPHKYQKACNIIKNQYKCKDAEYTKYNYAIHSHNCLNSDYIIDDMSDENVAKKAKCYIESTQNYHDTVLEDEKKKLMYNYLPIPIVIPQKNDRILAQSGTFVAFNLCSINSNTNHSKEGFYYLALENILSEYIEICKNNNIDYEENCFLERIIIPAYCINSISGTLDNTFNYSKESVYPDLENQLKNVKNTVLNYL